MGGGEVFAAPFAESNPHRCVGCVAVKATGKTTTNGRHKGAATKTGKLRLGQLPVSEPVVMASVDLTLSKAERCMC
jgi:hypothetical protein